MTRTALVTGAAGFIGRHFAAHLRDNLGYHVHGIDLVDGPEVTAIEDANDFFTSSLYDRFDLVVHAAYHVGGRATIDGNPSVLALNLALDANMFDWAVRTRQRHVLYFSSSAVYPVELQTGKIRADEPLRLREDHACIDLPLLPDARYGWAKLTGEKLAQAAREQGLTVSVVRPFSGYGWDQSTDYPFPSFIDRALSGNPVFEIWGSDRQSRDWIHVDDVIRGAVAFVEDQEHEIEYARYRSGRHTVNLGTGVRTTMRELAQLVCAEAEVNPEFRVLHDKPLGVMERVADISAMHNYYTPRILLRDGVREALEMRRGLTI